MTLRSSEPNQSVEATQSYILSWVVQAPSNCPCLNPPRSDIHLSSSFKQVFMRSNARYLPCFFDGVKFCSVSPPGKFDIESIHLLLLRCALQTPNSVGQVILDQLALLCLFVKIIDSVPSASHKTTVHYRRFLSDSRHSELVSLSVANSMNVEPRLCDQPSLSSSSRPRARSYLHLTAPRFDITTVNSFSSSIKLQQ